METLKKVITSFNTQKTLEPKIWEKNENKINPKVRKNLLEIAYQFIDSFGIDVVIDDIIVTGSIANYNWSEYSDVDLHILVDYKQFRKEFKDLYVEVFVEDSDLKGVSGGVYSVLNDEWIKKPTKENLNVSKEEIIRNAKKWMSLIDTLIKNLDDEDIETIRKSVKSIKDKLKKYRVSGLQSGGEMGIQNLVFKVLRRNGYIEKLYNIPMNLIDKKLSLKERIKN